MTTHTNKINLTDRLATLNAQLVEIESVLNLELSKQATNQATNQPQSHTYTTAFNKHKLISAHIETIEYVLCR